MTWEQKTEMCRMLNGSHYSQALDLVLENIETMDEQAWDMFYNGIELLEDVTVPQLEQHKIIRERNKDMKFDSFRTAMRASAHEMLVDCILKKQPNQS